MEKKKSNSLGGGDSINSLVYTFLCLVVKKNMKWYILDIFNMGEAVVKDGNRVPSKRRKGNFLFPQV